METSRGDVQFSLRPATQADAKTIRKIIQQVGNNPMALAWQRFVLAVDPSNRVVGVGQVKHHNDGSSELASISVLPEWRGRGVARKIIEYLLAQYPGRLFLTTRAELEPMYQKFGFYSIREAELTPYFRRISRIVAFLSRLMGRPNRLLVMRRD